MKIKKLSEFHCSLFAVLAAALIAAGCKNKDLEAFNALEKDRFLVKTDRAQVKDIEDYLILVGSVKAMDEAMLYPRVSGKLLRNLVTEGDAVKKDQTVALIERDEPGVVYEPAPVPSTLNGVIGRVYQDSGANVTPQTPIALVVSQGRVRVVLDVPERYMGKVFMNQQAYIKVDAFPDKLFRARVYRISPVVDTRTRSAVIELLADNSDNRLKPGMFSEIRLVVGAKQGAVAVPSAAVLAENGRSYIFVPADGTAARREVKTGISNGDYIELSGGLKAGEELITFGLYGLKDGSKIKVQNKMP
ncbi:MAG: efflux RND transporter periplasmic adaptor subunit [Elusimicrobiales bacterium]|jgi:multidrug efflux pump subunit AcrA (membrane-fusion protein)